MYTACLLVMASACSTTRNLPEGEVLYSGIKRIEIAAVDSVPFSPLAMSEIEAALAYPPNNALFGSSSVRSPLPFGLWIYNAFVGAEGGLGRWIFDKFAAKPVFVSTVNPGVRVAIAHNLLRENGYFDGQASYELIADAHNPRKAKLAYHIEPYHLYTYDSIRYVRTRSAADSLIALHASEQILRPGMGFSVASLEAERQRISSLLRSEGFYYHRPEFIVYQADTLLSPGKVSLRVMRKSGLPQSAMTPFRIGRVSFALTGYRGEQPVDSVTYRDMTVFYENKLRVRPAVLYKHLMLKPGDWYSEDRERRTQTAIARLQVFRFSEMHFEPRDTSRRNDLLDLTINTLYDLPLGGELEFNLTDKSNNLRGPGAIFTLTRYNLFGGGEVLQLEAKGSYEWQTNKARAGMNSYEWGAGASLTLPFVWLPSFADRGLVYPSFTTFRLSGNLLNRARFFRMLSFNAGLSYEFQPSPYHRHIFTPLRLTYNRMQSQTAEFDSIAAINPALRLSLADQFIPALSYTYTYDDSSEPRPHHVWWQASLSEAGNLLSGIYALAGNQWGKEGKKLLGNPFAQFLKLSGEFRYNHKLDKNNRVVLRLMAGIIASYGNSRVAPFSEQFYIGGANSIRAFNIRSIGPGRFIPADPHLNRYSYIDQAGDLKLEANLEYRFRILGNLFGATFMDWGGIWLLRNDPNRPGGTFSPAHLLNDMALGTGLGLRYDFDFLIIRLDAGLGLHLPYDTGRRGYYNLPRFRDSFAYHLAVGYPF
ncbi:MAG: BamA/TamA family outer membrane protein [Tannerellaceae bacterium]|jgi:outer membrane protein assembly factor BamA|nr:BamA/TamA family outer membrane protein [Tannerellaceae bacterium]